MYVQTYRIFQKRPWRKQKGGGVTLINLIHEIDNLRYIYEGEIERVYAEISNSTRNFDVEDTIGVTIKFKDGVITNIFMSDTAPSLWAYEATMRENSFFYPTNGNIYYFFSKASMKISSYYKNRLFIRSIEHHLKMLITGLALPVV